MPKFVVNKIHPPNPFMAHQCCVDDSEQARLAYDAMPLILKRPEINNWLYLNFGWASQHIFAEWKGDTEKKVLEKLEEDFELLFEENTFSFLLCHPRQKTAWIIQKGVQLVCQDYCTGGVTELTEKDIAQAFEIFKTTREALNCFLLKGTLLEEI